MNQNPNKPTQLESEIMTPILNYFNRKHPAISRTQEMFVTYCRFYLKFPIPKIQQFWEDNKGK